MTEGTTMPAEREAIVRWLRDKSAEFEAKANERLGRLSAHYLPLAEHYRMAANSIERGEHLKESTHE